MGQRSHREATIKSVASYGSGNWRHADFMHDLFKKVGRERGLRSEKLAQEALQTLVESHEIVSFANVIGTKEDKENCVDFLLTINTLDRYQKEMPLQVKSSHAWRRDPHYLERLKETPVLVVDSGITITEIASKIRFLIGQYLGQSLR